MASREYTEYLEKTISELSNDAKIPRSEWEKFYSLLGKLKEHNEDMYAHSLRVGIYAALLSKDEEWQDTGLPLLGGAGHDMGKCGISNEILDQKGILMPEQFAEVKKHPEEGYKTLLNEFPLPALVAGLHHMYQPHPYGISFEKLNALSPRIREEVEKSAKLVYLTDFFDAMTTRDDLGLSIEKTFPDRLDRIKWLFSHKITPPVAL